MISAHFIKGVVEQCYHFKKKSELHGPTCYVIVIWGKMKPWKNCALKVIIKCFKEVEIYKLPDLPYIFSPNDCSLHQWNKS